MIKSAATRLEVRLRLVSVFKVDAHKLPATGGHVVLNGALIQQHRVVFFFLC